VGTQIRLVAGLLERDGALLLVACRYPGVPEPLWHPPGGRPRAGELLEDALRREFAEETGLKVDSERLLYVSESFDRAGDAHVLSATFGVEALGQARLPSADAHVVALAWVPREEVLRRISVRVVREPLAAHLRGGRRRYYGFADAGITIAFADDP
jgi:8-oxo-dGTP diphosphatase